MAFGSGLEPTMFRGPISNRASSIESHIVDFIIIFPFQHILEDLDDWADEAQQNELNCSRNLTSEEMSGR